MASPSPSQERPYDYLLKILLVGDSDVGKGEILSRLDAEPADSPFSSLTGPGQSEEFSSFAGAWLV